MIILAKACMSIKYLPWLVFLAKQVYTLFMDNENTPSEQAASINPSDAAKAFSALGASKGGKARAASLSPDRRREIAQKAIEARWARKGIAPIPKATHVGTMQIGDLSLECAVLENGERVLSQRGFMAALDIKHGGTMSAARVDDKDGAVYPLFIAFRNLRSIIDNDLLAVLNSPSNYRHPSGAMAIGIKAELIPRVCEVWLKARDAGVLRQSQVPVATKADILIRGLAHVGIVALVDEATGYQDDRSRDALAKILEAFVAKELKKWVSTFQAEYYKQLFRLWGGAFNGSLKRPQFFGTLTNNLVYSRLAPGVLKALREKNPMTSKGYRQHKHFQWLTEDAGYLALKEHLSAVTVLMKASSDKEQFLKMLDTALPKYQEFPLFDLAKV
jgi:hypothetical protein